MTLFTRRNHASDTNYGMKLIDVEISHSFNPRRIKFIENNYLLTPVKKSKNIVSII